ncbi:MAG: hypothetical protein SPF56_08565 [Bacteroidaceae bacterium]|nr:hypothetical protein [Bacteroidaceae bacterium]
MRSILGNTRKADITFHISGRICLSARISKLLSLRQGDVIDIMVAERETYIYAKHRNAVGRHEGMVYRSKKMSNHYIASSKKLCSYMLEKCKAENKVKLWCGTPENFELYGIALPIIVNSGT